MAEGLTLPLALAEFEFDVESAPSPDAVESASPEDAVADRLNIFQDLMTRNRNWYSIQFRLIRSGLA